MEETMWAIARVTKDDQSFYFGTFPTRREAIITHIGQIYDKRFPDHGPMPKELAKLWKAQKEKGDRAVLVRVVLMEDFPPKYPK